MKSRYLFLLTALVALPATSHAQNFLVGIPGVEQGTSGSFDAYIQAVYVMFISIAALLAVVKIIIAGLKYMFTDIVTQKGDAKKDIQGALFGLLIVLSAVLILTIINPELTRFNTDISGVGLPPGTSNAQNNPPTNDNERFLAGAYRQVCAQTDDINDLCVAETEACQSGELFETSGRTGIPLRAAGQNNTVVVDCIPNETEEELLAEQAAEERELALGYAAITCNMMPDFYWDTEDDTCKVYTTDITEEREIPQITLVQERDRLGRDLVVDDYEFICEFIVGDPNFFPLEYSNSRGTCVQTSNRVEGQELAPDNFQVP